MLGKDLFVFAEKRCASPSPSIPPISREQALLETFFHALSQFAFDKAKDQVVSSFVFTIIIKTYLLIKLDYLVKNCNFLIYWVTEVNAVL